MCNIKISHLRLIITLCTLLGLLLKPLSLHNGVVQFRIGIAHFSLADEQLEALSESRSAAVGLGKRGHHLGVIGDKRGVDAGLLEEMAHQLVHESSHCAWGAAVNIMLHAELLQEGAAFGGLHGGELHSSSFLQSINHTDALPGR